MESVFIISEGNVRDHIDGKIRKETPKEYKQAKRNKRSCFGG